MSFPVAFLVIDAKKEPKTLINPVDFLQKSGFAKNEKTWNSSGVTQFLEHQIFFVKKTL